MDLRSHELVRSGRRVRLQEKSFLVLHELLKRPGEVVTREELAAALWPKEYFVDAEHGLNTAVRRLREALGDSADDARYVETLLKIGYRFVGAIEDRAGPPARVEPEERQAGDGATAATPAAIPPTTANAASTAQGEPQRSPLRTALVPAAILVVAVLAVVAAVGSRPRAAKSAVEPAPASSTRTDVVDELLARSRYLRNHKRVDEAMQFLQEALRLDPRNAEALGGLALHQIGTGNYEQGRETARRALELDPNAWEAHRALGNLARDQGDYRGAEYHYRRALAANPSDSKSRNRLARHLLVCGKVDEAKELILENRRIDPNDPDVQNIWVEHALRTGDYEEAIREGKIWLAIWEKPLADGPFPASMREALVLAHLGARRHEEALALCRGIEPRDGVCAALVHGHAGRTAEARRILEAIEKPTAQARRGSLLPDGLELEDGLPEAYILIGDFDRALELLDAQLAARNFPALLSLPFFHAIHDDPRWKEFRARLERTFFSGEDGPVPVDRFPVFPDSPRVATPGGSRSPR